MLDDLKKRCVATIEHLQVELTKMRSGRASGSIFEGMHVDYYGSSVPLISLGLINTPEPRLITIQIYDTQAVEAVEKAIRESELGLNPMREGALLRIPIPSLTEDRRKDLIKKLHKLAEETKVTLRGHRRDAIDALKKAEKAKEISADDVRRRQDEIQTTIDSFSSKVDDATKKKEAEMMEV